MGWTRKKTVGASERDEFLRTVWRALVAGKIDVERSGVFGGRDGLEHIADASACLGVTWRESALLCSAQPWQEHDAPGKHDERSSPDLNPVEEAFSKVKGLVRRAGARSRKALIEAMERALDAVTTKDTQGSFKHCGYPLPTQPLLQPL